LYIIYYHNSIFNAIYFPNFGEELREKKKSGEAGFLRRKTSYYFRQPPLKGEVPPKAAERLICFSTSHRFAELPC
jgi:hypothetical protein